MPQALTEAPAGHAQTRSDPAQELRDYMKMSYAEKMQWQWMQARGISKQAFDQMPTEAKQQLVDQMREDLKLKVDQGSSDSRVRIDIKV